MRTTPAVVPDLDQRLAKWKSVPMPFDAAKLSEREKKLVGTLVDACRYVEDMYWRQNDPKALDLWKSLADVATPEEKALRRLVFINGSRFDQLDENAPFVGTAPMPPGRALYPEGVTRTGLEKWIAAHPERKDEVTDGRTVVLRDGKKGFRGVPYREAHRAWLVPASERLREAAALSDDPAFAKFLRLRAEALLSDDYYESDLAWLDLVSPKFDLIYAPYETYLDGVLGVKTSWGAAVLIRNEEESAKLEVFQKYVPDIQDALPLDPEDRPSKKGHVASMEVMDTPFRAGDLRHGYQAVADNLPNDRRIHETKGTKRIFFKNYMDARVNEVILPLAKRLMRGDQAAKASADGYLAAVMMHEISHGIGPAYARKDGRKVDIRQAIGPVFSALEEAKADVTGMFGLAWLVEKGALPAERLSGFYASYVAGIFRTVRFGTGEAHGRAQMMEFDYLVEQGALAREAASGRWVMNEARLPGALRGLMKELLTIEATGDRARAEAWFAKHGAMPAELKTALDGVRDIPVDFDPVGSFAEGPR